MSGQIVDSAALKGMSLEEIAEATAAGRFDSLLKGADIRRGAKLTPPQWATVVENLTDAQLAQADADHLLDPLHEATQAPTGTSADQGARGKQYGSMRERLRDMSHDEIVAATNSGALDALLRGDVQ